MDSVTWSRLRPILEAALERPRAEREAFVRATCGEDPRLTARALELLRNEDTTSGVLEDTTPLGTRAAAAAGLPAPGERLGPWRLERLLGQGGMGAVWLGTRADAGFTQRVAIKLMRADLAGEEVLRRFQREQALLAALEHPGIARLIDVGRDAGGRPFLVMEFVEGEPIDAWCRQRGLGLRQRVELVTEVCDAVAHAHGRLVLHRDLKPGNVLVTSTGAPKLLDFGIGKLLEDGAEGQTELTATGQLVFTPHYASPEQVRGETVGTASDVYSLGVLLYELLTGERPYRFESGSPTEILRVVSEVDPRPPSAAARATTTLGVADTGRWSRQLEGDLDAIVLTALRKEPQRRYPSVEALADDLGRYLAGLPVRARPDTLGYRTRKFLRRHGVSVGVAAGLVLALTLGLAGTSYQFVRAEQALERESEQNALAQGRLVELQRLSGELEGERAAAVARADELERLSADLQRQRDLARRRLEEVRRFATTLVFDAHAAIRPLAGATAARELLVAQGLEHLGRLSADAGDDPALRTELAGAWLRMGDVLGEGIGSNLGRTAEAVEAYRRALELAAAIEAGSGETARSEGWPLRGEAGRKLADALMVLGRTDEAREALLETLAWLDGRVDEQAVDADLVSSLAALGRLVRLEAAAGRVEQAEALLERELDLTDRLLERHPRLAAARVERAEALQTAADVARAAGDPERTRACLEEACALIDEVLADGNDNALVRRHWYVARNQLGSELVLQGDPEQGLWLLEEDLEWVERLAEADPADLQLQRDLMTTLRRLGQASLEAGDARRSRESYARAAELARAAAAREPDNLDLASNVFLARLGEGQALARLGLQDEARTALAEAVEGACAVDGAAATDLSRRRTAWLVCLDAGRAAADAARSAEGSVARRRELLSQAGAHAARGLQLIVRAREEGAFAPRDDRALQRLEELDREARDLLALTEGQGD